MDTVARPRLRIVDGMVLIASVAAGLGLGRFVAGEDARSIAPGVGWHCPLALTLSWAVAALGWARRGFPRRRAFRAPGVLACAAVAIASAMALAATSHNLIGRNFRGLASAHVWRVLALW